MPFIFSDSAAALLCKYPSEHERGGIVVVLTLLLFECTGVHAKSNATSILVTNEIGGFHDSGFSYMVHMLFIWALYLVRLGFTSCSSGFSYMVHLGFISCSFELHIWFIMKITEVALLLVWTPVITDAL